MTTPRIAQITLDAVDPIPLARWWAERLGGQVTQENDGWFVVVTVPNSPALAFQKVEHPTPGKNRMHLDMLVDEIAGAVDEFVAAGATRVAEHSMGDFGWVILTDPQDNEFCLAAGH